MTGASDPQDPQDPRHPHDQAPGTGKVTAADVGAVLRDFAGASLRDGLRLAREKAFSAAIRPALYAVSGDDAETVHERTLAALEKVAGRRQAIKTIEKLFAGPDTRDPVTLFGVTFPNRLGLAAGMDKDGRCVDAWPALGFGFAEIGTVTRHAQPGNDRPRLFALPQSGAVINRMGFNNAGADALAQRLSPASRMFRRLPTIGISIGKSKVTPNDEAVEDYRHSFRVLAPYAHYIAINVSSPNTPGLRELQDKAALTEILDGIAEVDRELVANRDRVTPTPVLVKVAPDLSTDALAEVLEVVTAKSLAGVIATNTTIGRDGIDPAEVQYASEAGGLSGSPLTERAREVVAFISRETNGGVPIIGVGGIGSAEDALRMRDAGADLVQIYSAFALGGPQVPHAIAVALASGTTRA